MTLGLGIDLINGLNKGLSTGDVSGGPSNLKKESEEKEINENQAIESVVAGIKDLYKVNLRSEYGLVLTLNSKDQNKDIEKKREKEKEIVDSLESSSDKAAEIFYNMRFNSVLLARIQPILKKIKEGEQRARVLATFKGLSEYDSCKVVEKLSPVLAGIKDVDCIVKTLEKAVQARRDVISSLQLLSVYNKRCEYKEAKELLLPLEKEDRNEFVKLVNYLFENFIKKDRKEEKDGKDGKNKIDVDFTDKDLASFIEYLKRIPLESREVFIEEIKLLFDEYDLFTNLIRVVVKLKIDFFSKNIVKNLKLILLLALRYDNRDKSNVLNCSKQEIINATNKTKIKSFCATQVVIRTINGIQEEKRDIVVKNILRVYDEDNSVYVSTKDLLNKILGQIEYFKFHVFTD